MQSPMPNTLGSVLLQRRSSREMALAAEAALRPESQVEHDAIEVHDCQGLVESLHAGSSMWDQFAASLSIGFAARYGPVQT